MADLIIPTMSLIPRVPKGNDPITITTNAGVTIFVTDEVTVYQTDTIEKTVSVFDTSFIHLTATITATSTKTSPTTITKTQTLTRTSAPPTTTTLIINSSTSLLPMPTPTPICSALPAHAAVGKHVDAFKVLSIVFGVFILFLLALMWFFVRRFYKMYRAERVLRKQMQTEGTEMPETRMAGNGGETFVVGE